jgi:sulfhydrogenase subunit gamma (sulfur reductase)
MTAPGADPAPRAALSPAIVVRARDEGRHYRILELARPDPAASRLTLSRHRRPGQFVTLAPAAGGDESPFAIASPAAPHAESLFAIASPPTPEAESLEVLIRTGTGSADALAALGEGDSLLMSDPDGPGFELTAARGRHLLMLAAGSGIAPVRAAAHAIAADRAAFGDVALYYGQHHEDDFAYRADLDALATRDLRLVLVVSGDQPDWTGHRGYVQRLADAEWQHWNALLICGMPAMEEEARAIAHRRTVDLVLTNTGAPSQP